MNRSHVSVLDEYVSCGCGWYRQPQFITSTLAAAPDWLLLLLLLLLSLLFLLLLLLKIRTGRNLFYLII